LYNNFERPSPVSLLSSPSTIASSSFHGCVNWRGREGSFRGNESAKIYDGYKKSFAIYKRERERWTVVNLTNILRASFLPIFFWQKVKNTVSREKLKKIIFQQKSCSLNVGEIDICCLLYFFTLIFLFLTLLCMSACREQICIREWEDSLCKKKIRTSLSLFLFFPDSFFYSFAIVNMIFPLSERITRPAKNWSNKTNPNELAVQIAKTKAWTWP